jgi:cell division control protein 6
MPSFSEILNKPSVFADRNVLSPHYVPDYLPFREKEIEKIMTNLSPILKDERPRNMFIYGKTGTGKTCSVKFVISKLHEHPSKAVSCYVNCRMYNSRYRVIQKITKELLPNLDSMGFGLAMLYEKMLAVLDGKESGNSPKRLVAVLDEVDMVKDLDDLLYALTRCNDELKNGSVTIIGISNKLSFKEQLGQRSKSSLCENEIVFTPYTPVQLQSILAQRVEKGFKANVVDQSAINLVAAITGQDTGDARYALKLLMKAGEIADDYGRNKITDKEVEEARRSVDKDIAFEAIATLPDHQQLVLLAVANLTLDKSKNTKLISTQEEDPYLISGEVYEEYCKVAKKYRKTRRSVRWFREYLNDLEMLGLITMTDSGPGIRGRTRVIRIGYSALDVKKIVEKNFSIIESENKTP